jgi:glycosyltransferase A (GT-A) superfamily protein (DUF2064 family)
MTCQILVIAHTPSPGVRKPLAQITGAALRDTLAAAARVPAVRHSIVLCGQFDVPPGWAVYSQQGKGFDERLARAYADTARPGTASILLRPDTPQLTPEHIGMLYAGLADADAVLGPAYDGDWWGLALRNPVRARALLGLPLSTVDTARWTVDALRADGSTVAFAPLLRDVASVEDALAIARQCPPGSAFAAAVRRFLGEQSLVQVG